MKSTARMILLFVTLPVLAVGQQSQGLTPAVLDLLEKSLTVDAHVRATQHVLAQVDGNKISQDQQKINGSDQYFSLRLKDQKITDQKGTGRCWMFSGLNVLRPEVSRKLDIGEIELSQAYLFFFEKLEKANLFLDAVIATRDKPYTDRRVEFLLKQNVQDGQNWMGFVELVNKYGVVPKDVMPETFSSSNSGHVNQVLSLRLKHAAMQIREEASVEKARDLKMQAMKDVYKILALNFGLPPKVFDWRYENHDKKLAVLKGYSPQKFYAEYGGRVLDDYRAFYSIPTLAFNKKYEIDLDRTVSEQPDLNFVNIPLATMKDLAKTSLLDSTAVWFGCDVGQQSNSENGLMVSQLYDYASLYGMDFSLSRKQLFESYSTTPTHNMVLTGIDIVDGTVKKWLVENSWGESRGKKGYFTMLDSWFDDYVQEIVIHKRYLSPELLEMFNGKPTVLPPWDPMVSQVVR